MKKLIIGILIAAFSPANVCAQKLKVISATRQEWSGGVAGHYGSNYFICLKFSADNVELDSAYINNIGIKLVRGTNGNVRTDKANHTYTITAAESHDEQEYQYQLPNHDGDKHPLPVRHFNGAALILYKCKGKSLSLIVKEMHYLDPIAYP